MIHDEELRSSMDYSEGQKKAAHRVLIMLTRQFITPKMSAKIENRMHI